MLFGTTCPLCVRAGHTLPSSGFPAAFQRASNTPRTGGSSVAPDALRRSCHASPQPMRGKLRGGFGRYRIESTGGQRLCRAQTLLRRDGCGEPVILGKRTASEMPDRPEYRSHIYEVGEGRLAVCLVFPTKNRWTYAKKKLRAAGFTVLQDGDMEGTASFDASVGKQAHVAIRITGAKARRRASSAQIAGLHRPSLAGQLSP
jgi:hypothetical protein